jgi:RimJ/RimL family protein N-acetyltransferase
MRLCLVPLGVRHAPHLLALAGNDATMPWTATPPASARQATMAFVARAQRLRAKGMRETFAVCDAERVVGIAVLTRDPSAPDRAELGYWIGRPHRGRGYATAAARQLASYGFTRMGLAVVVARCASANRTSARVVEKLGFRFAGLEPPQESTSPADPVRRYELACHEWRHSMDP